MKEKNLRTILKADEREDGRFSFSVNGSGDEFICAISYAIFKTLKIFVEDGKADWEGAEDAIMQAIKISLEYLIEEENKND